MVSTGKRFSPSLDCISSGSGVWKRSTVNQVSCGTFIHAGEILWQTSHFFHSFFCISSPFASYPLASKSDSEKLKQHEVACWKLCAYRAVSPQDENDLPHAPFKKPLGIRPWIVWYQASRDLFSVPNVEESQKKVRHLEHTRWCVVVEYSPAFAKSLVIQFVY